MWCTKSEKAKNINQRKIPDFEEVKSRQVWANESKEIDDGVIDWPAFVVQSQKLQPLQIKQEQQLK